MKSLCQAAHRCTEHGEGTAMQYRLYKRTANLCDGRAGALVYNYLARTDRDLHKLLIDSPQIFQLCAAGLNKSMN